MSEVEIRPYYFRGGPLDGRRLPVPVTANPQWCIPTVDGIWVGDRAEPLPEDLSDVDYRYENYWRVGEGDEEEFVHQTLVDELPPDARPFGG